MRRMLRRGFESARCWLVMTTRPFRPYYQRWLAQCSELLDRCWPVILAFAIFHASIMVIVHDRLEQIEGRQIENQNATDRILEIAEEFHKHG